jgi:hypothetical protein
MPVHPELRKLDIDIPSQPQALLELSLLLAEDDINLQEASALIEGDMALAAAVMKAVNSSLYGLKGRVQSVHQAITYLGVREVAAITFEMGLRAAFPPTPELDPIWRRAAWRGLLMGRLAQRLAWGAVFRKTWPTEPRRSARTSRTTHSLQANTRKSLCGIPASPQQTHRAKHRTQTDTGNAWGP